MFMKRAPGIYRILHELSFNTYFYKSSSRNVIKQASGELS